MTRCSHLRKKSTLNGDIPKEWLKLQSRSGPLEFDGGIGTSQALAPRREEVPFGQSVHNPVPPGGQSHTHRSLGFGVWGLGLGSGSGIWDLGSGVWGLTIRSPGVPASRAATSPKVSE